MHEDEYTNNCSYYKYGFLIYLAGLKSCIL
jgi:hypothetical protein